MIRLNIDGKQAEVRADSYILQAAHTLGIQIPTMCFESSLEPFATCMVCVVKDRHSGKLMPSCSVRAEEGMDLITDDEEVREARRTALELLLSDHVGDCEAPCQIACPAHMNIPLMNRCLAAGAFDQALEVVMRDIALPSILGRICPAPCEGACRRKPVDQAVSICLLKRFAGDEARIQLPVAGPTGRSVAVIGSGPAGLSAAWYLQGRGISCDIFDAGREAGGALRYKVSREQLPLEVLDREIQAIRSAGVNFQQDFRVDRKTFERLRRDYDALVVATGDLTEGPGEWGLAVTDKGVRVEKKKYTTSLDGVFAAGNVIRSQKMAVRAAGQGKEVAWSIAQYLSGHTVTGEPRMFNSRFGKLVEAEHETYLLESVAGQRHEPAAGPGGGFDREEVRSEAARCMHCDCRKVDDCRLRELSDRYNANQRRFWDPDRKLVRKSMQHELVVYEPGKCIKCSICVRLTEKHGEEIGLSFIGRGFDVEIGVPLNDSMRDALKKTAAIVADACPTGALARKKDEMP